MNRTVAIVGRPNVGKSRLFNRLARKRISIVHDQPGITRDVISAEIADGNYTLLDTGGIGYKGKDTPAALTAASETASTLGPCAPSWWSTRRRPRPRPGCAMCWPAL